MIKPPLIEPYSWTLGIITSNITYVKCGVKPIAAVQTHNLYLENCKKEVENAGLFYAIEPKGEKHTTLYLYADDYLKNIINYILDMPYDKDILTTWVEGKMFGYSEEKIGKYIKNNYKSVSEKKTLQMS
jgi:hypothetical protein